MPVSVGDGVSADELLDQVATIPGFVDRLDELVMHVDPELPERLGANETLRQSVRASMAEFVLEALHCHYRLNKVGGSGMSQYGS